MNEVPSRRRMLAALAALPAAACLTFVPAALRAATSPEAAAQFMTDMANEGLRILRRPNISDGEIEQELRRFLRERFDMRLIGRFVLGNYWRAASEPERAEYLRLFEDLVVKIYARRFRNYAGENFTVTGQEAADNGDALVSSRIVPQAGNTVNVIWRLRGEGGQPRVIDIIVEGISLSITQRSEFSSIIERAGGTVAGLNAELERRITSGNVDSIDPLNR